MAIEFSCACGRKLRVKDVSAGREFVCPSCKSPVIAPSMLSEFPGPMESVFVPVKFAEDSQPTDHAIPQARSTPFWKNPIILIGGVFPATVLVCFATYLWWEASAKSQADHIRSIKLEADELSATRPEDALDRYEQLIAEIGETAKDPGELAILSIAKSNRDHLVEVVRPIRAKRKAEAERVANQLIQTEKLQNEIRRLASIRATISGKAWVETKLGITTELRGVTVTIIPAYVPASSIRPLLNALMSDPRFGSVARQDWGQLKDDQFVDMLGVWRMIRAIGIGPDNPDGEEKYRSFRDDIIWPMAVKRVAAVSSETGFDGNYTIKDVRGGKYYIVSSHVTYAYFVEWVSGLSVEESGQFEKNLHINNAINIQNNEVGDRVYRPDPERNTKESRKARAEAARPPQKVTTPEEHERIAAELKRIEKEAEAIRAKSVADEAEATRVAAIQAKEQRASELLRLGQSLEKQLKIRPALNNYRDLVEDYPDTPSAKVAVSRIEALDRPPGFAGQDPSRVIRIIDGMTIVVSMAGKESEVRLLGLVDFPRALTRDDGGKGVKRATMSLSGLLDGSSVYLAYEPGFGHLDSQGRILAFVYRSEDRLLINRELIMRGFGCASTNGSFSLAEELRNAESRARTRKVGMWAP
jgi:micrococcal nuclease